MLTSSVKKVAGWHRSEDYNGAIYLTKRRFMKRQYVADKADIVVMDPNENVDVDYPEDFAKVEAILRSKQG